MAIHPLSAAIYCNKWKLKTLNINQVSANIDLFYSIMNKKLRESPVKCILWEYYENLTKFDGCLYQIFIFQLKKTLLWPLHNKSLCCSPVELYCEGNVDWVLATWKKAAWSVEFKTKNSQMFLKLPEKLCTTQRMVGFFSLLYQWSLQ